MKRIKKASNWTLVPALVVIVVSAVTADEPRGFEQMKLESGVTVADIEPLKDGRLLMVLDQDGELRGCYSKDTGKTWKASFQLLRKPDGNAGYHHPSLTRAANGDLLLSYQYYVRKTRPVYKISYYRRSKDEGKTWGDQLFMAADGLFNDKPIRLSTGRLIAPVEREAQVEGGDHAGYVSSVFFSDDNGYSWTKSNEVNALPIEAQEPHVVELKDGRLMMLCRTYSRFVLRSYSNDKGKTWSKGEPIPELKLPAWSSALVVKRIPSTGDLLLLRSQSGEAGVRSPFVSVISKDDGKTWTNERIIAGDPKERYGYPCLLFIADTAIIGYGSFAGSRVARIPVKWFYEKTRASAATESLKKPRLVSKEVFLRHENRRPHITGFVSYVSKSQPVLMHCSGREDYSDAYDDYAIRISRDNGKSWSPPEARWRSTKVPTGRVRYAEPAAYFDADREKLIVLINKYLYPGDKLDVDTEYQLELNVYDAATGKWSQPRLLSFPGQRTPGMSFSFPIKTSRGELLFPAFRQVRDAQGKAVHYKGHWAPVDEFVTVIGRWNAEGSLSWRMGNARQIDPSTSSRGLNENALTQLADGRIAAICRGDNGMFPDKPGYKWLCFSRNHGVDWSPPLPLPATGGEPIESAGNGSALFRSTRNGRLYWLGNLAIHGERPHGNFPRAPLCLVEVQEQPFALKRESIFVVDKRQESDSPEVQLSNFRFYQDRETAELVVFLTRYGERSAKDWMLADYYRYRVALPGQ